MTGRDGLTSAHVLVLGPPDIRYAYNTSLWLLKIPGLVLIARKRQDCCVNMDVALDRSRAREFHDDQK